MKGDCFMNRFELFCLMFFAIDTQWDNSPSEVLGDFLSSANPFFFDDIGSADPSCYDDFCKSVNENIVELNDSYKIAKTYIENLGILEVTEAFKKTNETQWLEAAKKYLSTHHKGEF